MVLLIFQRLVADRGERRWLFSFTIVKAQAAVVGPLTLNQRVQGSNPCAPTNNIKDLAKFYRKEQK
jgi:hypothetical protein